MIFCELVVISVALKDLQCAERHLYGLYALSVNGRRENKRVFFEIILILIYAVVHRLSFLPICFYAVKDVNLD